LGAPTHPQLQIYAIQYVGVQMRGVSQPRSPMSPKGNRCLTIIGSKGAKFQKCQLDDIGDETIDTEIRERQKFTFTPDGQIRSYMLGLCLHRSDCQGLYVYDFAACGQPFSARFRIKKSMASSVTKVRSLGTPFQALNLDYGCTFCGPYLVLQRCKGQEVENGSCNPSKVRPGWTKLRTQYVVPEKVSDDDVFSDILGSGRDILGVGELRQVECNTLLTDGPSTTSFFFFKHMGVAESG